MNITTTTMHSSPLSVLAFGPFGPLEYLARKVIEFFKGLQFTLFCCDQKAKRALRSHMDYVINGESGIGTIEMVLILVVLIALVLVFKGRINDLLTNIFDQIDSSAQSVY
ncbi:Putative Flagellin, Flp1-like, domain [Oribacterium sp. KHPX15]|uniref:Flp1 family type IVb pilin n=1 Tax=Oribacterium sp. KHPX15 TaxID=1855342 RepID=UPI000899A3AE|nr:Flp1 family type IVb pilin [Oribacterium sp. KHPX15]SEA13836.1 Putative Flagellin, Flp1-like, domain [Oribacterium sp. KHPX15]